MAARARVGRMVAGLAEMLRESLSDAAIDGYVEALIDVPFDELREGFARVAKYSRFFPRPAEIREAVDAANRERRVVEQDRDVPFFAPPICARCEDNGWVCVAERTDAAAPAFRRCSCYTSNPKLVHPKQHSQERDR